MGETRRTQWFARCGSGGRFDFIMIIAGSKNCSFCLLLVHSTTARDTSAPIIIEHDSWIIIKNRCKILKIPHAFYAHMIHKFNEFQQKMSVHKLFILTAKNNFDRRLWMTPKRMLAGEARAKYICMIWMGNRDISISILQYVSSICENSFTN